MGKSLGIVNVIILSHCTKDNYQVFQQEKITSEVEIIFIS